jgi:hypothetical protein
MRMWHSSATVPGSPADILAFLTEPEAIARWAPVRFETLAIDGDRLRSGSHARVAGHLAGRYVEFDVDVLQASADRLELLADGPISLGVRYVLRPLGERTEVDASVSVEGRGPFGRVLAKATEALLAAGALRLSLDHLGRELQPPLAA